MIKSPLHQAHDQNFDLWHFSLRQASFFVYFDGIFNSIRQNWKICHELYPEWGKVLECWSRWFLIEKVVLIMNIQVTEKSFIWTVATVQPYSLLRQCYDCDSIETKALETREILTPNIIIKRYFKNLKIFSHIFLLVKLSSLKIQCKDTFICQNIIISLGRSIQILCSCDESHS